MISNTGPKPLGIQLLIACLTRPAAVALGAGLALAASPAIAADRVPELHQPIVDDLGLDRKIGRILTPTPEQISVGGDGPQKISIAYMPVNPGRPGSQDTASVNFLDMRIVGHVSVNRTTSNTVPINYEYYTIQYPEGSETFRRDLNSSNVFSAEYPNGGILTATTNGVLFIDRNGIKLETKANSLNETILTYPDGRQIFYGDASLGWLRSSLWQGASISNNFGFSLKYQTDIDGFRTVASNRIVDICEPSATSCPSLSKDRHSVIAGNSNDVLTFRDAGGGITLYRTIPIQAYTAKQYCYYDGIIICNSPFLVTRYYPAGIKFPKDASESITISYSNPDSQDEVGVSSISKNGTTITYVQQRMPYGQTGYDNNLNVLPYKLMIKSSIGANQLSFSQSDRGYAGWGGGRMVLNFVDDAVGNRTTFDFNLLFEVSGVRLPEGNGQRFEYDARWNITAVYDVPKTGSGSAELVTQYAYPATCSPATQAFCNKPSAIIDRRGNRSDFSYNTMGQLLTEMGPADAAGARSTTTYEYTLRTAYIKDLSGNPIAAGLPISLLTKKTVCRSQQACIGTTDAVVTTYEYGPTSGLNNLLLRGVVVAADGQTQRTCYQYNYFGDRISETQPKAGLTSCP